MVSISVEVRDALLAEDAVTADLPDYKGSYPIFTRRPVPADAKYPLVVVAPEVFSEDVDGLSDSRPIQSRDIFVYGRNDTSAEYRVVEKLAALIYDLFHRKWQSISVSGWKVVSIVASGPSPAPVDDEQIVGRRVELTVQLAKLL